MADQDALGREHFLHDSETGWALHIVQLIAPAVERWRTKWR
jgi:hypothetical protein